MRSAAAKRKDRTRETPVQSFPDLLASLSSLTAIELGYEKIPCYGVPMLSKMTPLQAKAFELLGSEQHPRPGAGPPLRKHVHRLRTAPKPSHRSAFFKSV